MTEEKNIIEKTYEPTCDHMHRYPHLYFPVTRDTPSYLIEERKKFWRLISERNFEETRRRWP